jgi:hypothetical protein
MWVGRWVGGKSFESKKNKRNWVGGREKIKLQKKTEIRAEKGQRKKNQPQMTRG